METPLLVVRIVLLACLVWTIGSLLFLTLLGRMSESADRRARILAIASSVLGLAALAATTLLQLLEIGGDWQAAVDPYTIQLFLETGGVAAGLRLAGCLLAVPAAFLATRVTAWAPVIVLTASFGFGGHTTSHEPETLLRVVVAGHVFMAAFWLGALLPLARAASGDEPAATARLASRFSLLATVSVALLVIGGGTLAMLLSQAAPWEWTATDWGRGLLVKLAGVSALLLFAAYHRWSLTPRIAAGDAAAGRRLQASIRLETLVAVLVLVATAWFAYQHDPLGR